jgi:hypothetical protein
MLKIRSLKTTRVTFDDTDTENCLGKAKFTSAEGCTSMCTHAQKSRKSVPPYIPDMTNPGS